MPQRKSEFIIPTFIIHWNSPMTCLSTVNDFLKQNIKVDISILDNNSSLDNFQILQKNLPKEVRLMRSEENLGWGKGFNILLKQWVITGDYPFCFISSHDTIIKPFCLEMLIESMNQFSEIGIASPDYGDYSLPTYSPIFGPKLIETTPRQKGTVEFVDFAHATLSIFRKDCIKQINLFDERFFAYGDEYDISLRARKYGWKTAIVWGATVGNPGTVTPRPVMSFLFARNTLLLAQEHGNSFLASVRLMLMFINSLKHLFVNFLSSKESSNGFDPKYKLIGILAFLKREFGRPKL